MHKQVCNCAYDFLVALKPPSGQSEDDDDDDDDEFDSALHISE